MNTYLITGGAGFIGSNFIRHITEIDKSAMIINVDKLTYAANLKSLSNISTKENYYFVKEDICNDIEINKIFSYYNPDYVINFAAESHVDRSIESSEEFVKTNVLGTQILLQASLRNKIKKYIQISTDEVYGSIEEGYFVEDSPLKPNNPYAASKGAGDLLVQSFYNTYRLPVNITRCTNNFGPNQHYEKFIPMVIGNSLKRKKITIYGDGLNIRDWIYVLDHCRGVYDVLKRGIIGDIYNIGSNTEKYNIYIAKTIIGIIREILKSISLASL